MSTRTAMEKNVAPAPQPYWLAPGGGDSRWVLKELDAIKATAAQTGGLFGLKESLGERGGGPPLHVHEREDEACYVLDGEITFFVGDDVIQASAGTWLYLPRRIPHSLRIESDTARTLWWIVPGGFESYFTETFPPRPRAAARLTNNLTSNVWPQRPRRSASPSSDRLRERG